MIKNRRKVIKDAGCAQDPGKAAERILFEMVEHGRLLVEICGDKGMPSRSTVYRWLANDPAFAARVEKAREAAADHAVWQADKVIQDTKPETANADRIKLIHLHWKEASRMAPGKYSERRISELTGKDGATLLPESKPVVLDASKMTPEARDMLRGILEQPEQGEKAQELDRRWHLPEGCRQAARKS